MVDQFDIAHTARNLLDLYRELNAAKKHQVIREARVTRPTPGPQAPTPTHLLSLEVDLTTRLREMTSECMLHLNTTAQAWPEPTSLCTWIRHNAGPISQLDVAEALLDELTDQAKEIKHKIDNLPGAEPNALQARQIAKAANKRYSAASVAALASSATGKTVDRKQVTYWGRAGNKGVTAEIGADGTATYDLEEVIEAALDYRDNRRKDG